MVCAIRPVPGPVATDTTGSVVTASPTAKVRPPLFVVVQLLNEEEEPLMLALTQ